jgi:hypothetical protein
MPVTFLSDFQTIVEVYEHNTFKLTKQLIYYPRYNDMRETVDVILENKVTLKVF